MGDPVVSIVIPTHNRAALLRRAIGSVLAQTLSAWELVIIDDASADETPEVLARFATQDPRIRVIRREKHVWKGISENLNLGIEAARAKYIARLDDDDHWCDTEKLRKQVQFLDSHPECVLVGGGVIVEDATGKELFRYLKKETDEQIRESALLANPFSHTTVMFRRQTAVDAGGYGDWPLAEDWEFWLRLGLKGKLANIPEYFTGYLLAGQNSTFLNQRRQAGTIIRLIANHKNNYPHYAKALFVAYAQYAYSLLPMVLRKRLHVALTGMKRKSF